MHKLTASCESTSDQRFRAPPLWPRERPYRPDIARLQASLVNRGTIENQSYSAPEVDRAVKYCGFNGLVSGPAWILGPTDYESELGCSCEILERPIDGRASLSLQRFIGLSKSEGEQVERHLIVVQLHFFVSLAEQECRHSHARKRNPREGSPRSK